MRSKFRENPHRKLKRIIFINVKQSPFPGAFAIFVKYQIEKTMKKLLLLIFIAGILSSCGAQKVKGSRNVTTEETRLKDFTSVEISGEFEVEIGKGESAFMQIKADDNLHSVIQAEVSNGTLYIKPTKKITRSKSQEIRITFPQELDRIVISEKVELESFEDLYLEDTELRLNDDSKAWLTVTAAEFQLYNNGKSKAELNLTAENAYFQLNNSSDIKALVNAPVFKVDSYEKASAKIEGETEEFELRAEHSTKFDGSKLTAKNATVIAEGRSRNEVEVLENLKLTAKDKTKIDIYGNPEIEMVEFTESSQISKKD